MTSRQRRRVASVSQTHTEPMTSTIVEANIQFESTFFGCCNAGDCFVASLPLPRQGNMTLGITQYTRLQLHHGTNARMECQNDGRNILMG
eukprot:scaffold22603_cov116-Cylindrotheca_fusiformis.AAC.2